MPEQTYGEGQLYVGNKHCGVVHLQDIHAYGSIIPRMFARFGFRLIEREPEREGDPLFVQDFIITDIRGELRLSQAADGFVTLEAAQNPDSPYSQYNPNDYQQVSLSGNVNPWLLERVEEWRKGQEPSFYVQLWFNAYTKMRGQLATRMQPFQVTIPQLAWGKVLAGLRHNRFALLEVPYETEHEQEFRKSLTFLERAGKAFNEGRYEECVIASREALAALVKETKHGKLKQTDPGLETYFVNTAPERADSYKALLKSLRDLGNEGTHGNKAVRRAEAMFVYQTVQHSLALLGAISRPKE